MKKSKLFSLIALALAALLVLSACGNAVAPAETTRYPSAHLWRPGTPWCTPWPCR